MASNADRRTHCTAGSTWHRSPAGRRAAAMSPHATPRTCDSCGNARAAGQPGRTQARGPGVSSATVLSMSPVRLPVPQPRVLVHAASCAGMLCGAAASLDARCSRRYSCAGVPANRLCAALARHTERGPPHIAGPGPRRWCSLHNELVPYRRPCVPTVVHAAMLTVCGRACRACGVVARQLQGGCCRVAPRHACG